MRKTAYTTDKLRASQFPIYTFVKLCIYPDVLSNSLSCYQTFTFGNTVNNLSLRISPPVDN